MILKLAAPAKINLSLEILGKRNDGYHEIATIMQTVSLCDRLYLGTTSDLLSSVSTVRSDCFGEGGWLTLACDREDLLNGDNLVVKAAELMVAKYGVQGDVTIIIQKRIPLAAGLGGGSSDAAGAIRGLAQLWNLDGTTTDLAAIAERIGSDVPFFLYGGACLAEGRGEKITQLSPFAPFYLVLLKPVHNLEGKTKLLYSALSKKDFADGEATKQLTAVSSKNGKIPGEHLVNSFKTVLPLVFPEIEEYEAALIQAGADNVHLTGSGPTLFSLVESEAEARIICGRLRERGFESYWAESTTLPSASIERALTLESED